MKITWQLTATAAAVIVAIVAVAALMTGPSYGPPMPTATAAPSQAAPTQGTPTATSLVIGPEGRIAYSQWVSTDFGTFTIKPDGTGGSSTLVGPASSHPRWAPDGSRLWVALYTWAGGGPEPRPPGTYAGSVRVDGSDLQTFALPAGAPSWLLCTAWSPDGSRIACGGNDPDSSRTGIYTVRTSDGQDPVRLTTTPPGYRDVPGDYSPDGRQVAFVRTSDGTTGSEGDGELWVMNADGSNQRRLTSEQPFDGLEGDSSDSLDWSPDGTTILASLNGYGYLVSMDGRVTRIVIPKSPAGRDVLVRHPRWSPDGMQIVFVTHLGPMGPQVDDVLAVVNPDGTDLFRTDVVATSPDWWAP